MFNFKKHNNKLEPEIVEKIKLNQTEDYICPNCKKKIKKNEWEKNLKVCSFCNFHTRISARERINIIFDSFLELEKEKTSFNVLNFPNYNEKLSKAKIESGENEAVIIGRGEIGEIDTATFIMESKFMMGSMGSVVGEKIAILFEYATKEKLPVIGFTASGGARMQEGMFSLMQMVKTSGAVKMHSNEKILYITVICDPTTGGVTASFANDGDIIVAEPNALFGFAGKRVIEQTIRAKIPKDFQRAETMEKKGFIDLIINRIEMKQTLIKLLRIHNYGTKY